MTTRADTSGGEIPRKRPEKIRCDACPVMCYVAEGQTGACDRYANEGGRIVRCDPLTIIDKRIEAGGEVVPFLAADWNGSLAPADTLLVTGIGSGTPYRSYTPAPFIQSRNVGGADVAG